MRLRGAALLLLLAGCTIGSPGDVGTARTLAQRYLAAIAGGEVDRGWSLVLPDSRRAYRDQEEYLELAQSVDWDAVRWRLTGGEADYCEDGGVYCLIRLEIPDAATSVPRFLIEAPQSQPDDHFATLVLDEDPLSEGNAQIVIYFDSDGDRGVLLGGG